MTNWPHAPPHRLMQPGAYIVTCGTYHKSHMLDSARRLDFMQETFFDCARGFKWQIHAWAFLSNHYHFVGSSPESATTLRRMLSKLHAITSRTFNREDQTPARRVWYQYFDSRITYPKSYCARLNYVHRNPAHHGVVDHAANYRWCSAAWFEQRATPAFHKMVQGFKTDRISVMDGYEPVAIVT